MSASHFVQNRLDRFESVGFVNANFAEDRQTVLAANHEEDSVSNKSHSAHNWHLRSALMQAINVSWYQPVCRENPFDRLPSPCLPKLWRLQSPLILPSRIGM